MRGPSGDDRMLTSGFSGLSNSSARAHIVNSATSAVPAFGPKPAPAPLVPAQARLVQAGLFVSFPQISRERPLTLPVNVSTPSSGVSPIAGSVLPIQRAEELLSTLPGSSGELRGNEGVILRLPE